MSDTTPAEPRGCDACRVMGPLITARGTSGRSWRCECGEVWSASPVRDHAGADMAHRDDLARDVARLWTVANPFAMLDRARIREDFPPFAAALDRLAAAYGTGEQT